MRLLLLNYEFPPLGGGAGNATQALARSFVKKGYVVTVVTTCFEGLPKEDVSEGYTVYRLSAVRKKKDRSNIFEMLHYVILASVFCSKLIKKEKQDYIISFFAVPTGMVGYYLKKKFKIPYMLSLRGGDVPGFLHNELKWLHRLSKPVTYFVWRNADTIVANSKGLQELALKTATRFGKNVEYIPNGVDTSIYKTKENEDASSDSSILKMLFVGRLVPQKKVLTILKAVAQIIKSKENNCDLQVTIIGDGPLRSELESEAESLGVTKKVIFKGWLERDEVRKEYKKNDIFILPSSEEGMPNVVLEAMASGLAIVASDISGTDELVRNGENGILVSSDTDYSKAILSLVEDRRLLNKFQIKSREIAKEFDWEEVAKKYLDLCSKK